MLSEGEGQSKMARKRIETALSSWLEITSSSVSKAIRSLTTPDMALLTINESPESGRENGALTAKGGEFIEQLNACGMAYLQALVDELSDDERWLHTFLRGQTKSSSLILALSAQTSRSEPLLWRDRHPHTVEIFRSHELAGQALFSLPNFKNSMTFSSSDAGASFPSHSSSM